MIYQNIKNISFALFISLFAGVGAVAMPLSVDLTATYGGTDFTLSGAPVPSTVADLGGLNGNTSVSGVLGDGQVNWYSFQADAFTFLDINSNNSSFDTELGLYDAFGNLIGNDDDDGISLSSTLTFGTGSGLLLGDAFNLGGDGIADGEDGALAAGLYYLAIGQFNTGIATSDFNVTAGTQCGGDYTIDFYTDASTAVPVSEPSILLLIGLGLVGIGFARRK